MVIEILGIESEKTSALAAAVAQALAELGLQDGVTVRHISDPAAIVARGARRWPALSVAGRVVCRGRVPSAAEVRALLEAAKA
jgi:hypothetical protein